MWLLVFDLMLLTQLKVWNVEIALIILIDLTSILQLKQVIKNWSYEKDPEIFWIKNKVIVEKDPSPKSLHDTETIFISDRTNPLPFIGNHDPSQNCLTFAAMNSLSLSRFHSGSHLTDHTRPETELYRKTSIEPNDRRV
jgi:hypothetical protein